MSYTLTFSFNSGTNPYYSVTGYTGTPVDVVIPSTYNDGENGEYPVQEIATGAFILCQSLTSIIIPNSIINIGNSVFYGCQGLTNVTIGNSVQVIGGSVFMYCRNLMAVYLFAVTPPALGDSVFSDVPTSTLKLYCFNKSLSAYKGATNWNDYIENIIADDLRMYFVANANAAKTKFVPASRTIAGNALTGDISAQALTDSLVYMNTTSDLDDVFTD